MAATESAMLALGTPAPAFSLKDVRDGKTHTVDSLTGPKGLLVMFICTHCPFVKHVEQELAKIGRDYQKSGIGIVAISSNDADNYPDDSPEGLAAQAKRVGFVFPYLYDETQEVAHAYAAACTPDFFLFDGQKKLAYRGQLDSQPPRQRDSRHRQGSPRRAGRARRRARGVARAEAEHRLQHQVEVLAGRAGPGRTGEGAARSVDAGPGQQRGLLTAPARRAFLPGSPAPPRPDQPPA